MKHNLKTHDHLTKVNIMEVLGPAYYAALTPENVKASFKVTGIYPFSPEAITEDEMAPSLAMYGVSSGRSRLTPWRAAPCVTGYKMASNMGNESRMHNRQREYINNRGVIIRIIVSLVNEGHGLGMQN